MARGKMGVFPAAADATLDLVPIDHVAEGIVRIAENFEAAQGQYLHLVAAQPLPARALADAVVRVEHFPDPQVVEPEAFDPAALPPAARRVTERLLASFGSYFRHDPRFATDRFAEVTGLACPPTDEAWLDRMVAYGIARGYLPPAPSARPDNGAPASRAAHPEPMQSRP